MSSEVISGSSSRDKALAISSTFWGAFHALPRRSLGGWVSAEGKGPIAKRADGGRMGETGRTSKEIYSHNQTHP